MARDLVHVLRFTRLDSELISCKDSYSFHTDKDNSGNILPSQLYRGDA
jgi:hypothetical protein